MLCSYVRSVPAAVSVAGRPQVLPLCCVVCAVGTGSGLRGRETAGVTSVLCSYVRSVPAAVSVAERPQVLPLCCVVLYGRYRQRSPWPVGGGRRSAAVRAAASGAAPAPVCPPPTVRPHDDPSQGHAAEGQTWAAPGNTC